VVLVAFGGFMLGYRQLSVERTYQQPRCSSYMISRQACGRHLSDQFSNLRSKR
jgi:hypothetical protein